MNTNTKSLCYQQVLTWISTCGESNSISFPLSKIMILSEWIMVLIRWAIVKTVASLKSSRTCSWMNASVLKSTFAVAFPDYSIRRNGTQNFLVGSCICKIYIPVYIWVIKMLLYIMQHSGCIIFWND